MAIRRKGMGETNETEELGDGWMDGRKEERKEGSKDVLTGHPGFFKVGR